MIRTKVVATVGPACNTDSVISAMIEAGVNVFRLNFSHGTLDGHLESLERIRRLASGHGVLIAVMGDLCGPKIRIGQVAGGSFELATGQTIIIQREDIEGTSARLSSNYASLIDDVEVGHRVLIDDGNVHLKIVAKHANEILCHCEAGGVISTRKGINLPDSHVSSPTLTDKDRRDVEWAMQHEVDFLAMSFVRGPEDMTALRSILREADSPIRLVSKIERPEAIEHLEAIIQESDVVLVARGDLGVEMDVSRVPIIQKEISLLSRRAGKPVIVATQMLQSMVTAPIPTRAEVSDVANAILDGADAVMLSAETSVGQHPMEAVRMMRRIAGHTESFYRRHGDELRTSTGTELEIATAVVRGASQVAETLNTRLIAVWTENGDTARLLSRYRVSQPIVALASQEKVCRQMSVMYGVIPIHLDHSPDLTGTLKTLDQMLQEQGLAARGDRIVVTLDIRPDLPGETDALLLHEVGD